jgi:hypothetical protein
MRARGGARAGLAYWHFQERALIDALSRATIDAVLKDNS